MTVVLLKSHLGGQPGCLSTTLLCSVSSLCSLNGQHRCQWPLPAHRHQNAMGCGVSRSLPASLEAAPIAPEQKRAVKTKAKRIDPGMEHYFRANGLRERGCTAAAIDEYTLALHINPSFATGTPTREKNGWKHAVGGMRETARPVGLHERLSNEADDPTDPEAAAVGTCSVL